MEETLRYELQKRSTKREIYDWIESVVFALICMVLIFTFVGRVLSVKGHSMEPTLSDQDRLLSSRLFYTPKYGDIVVITQPNDINEPLIKRVIATEGQTININFDTGMVQVDGIELNEPYILEETHLSYDIIFPQIIPKGHVFVMGDNRNGSWDSRASGVGMVDQRYILGRIVFRVSPLDTIGDPDAYWEKVRESQ